MARCRMLVLACLLALVGNPVTRAEQEEGLNEPPETFYSTWEWQEKRGRPFWIPLEEAKRANFRDLDESRQRGLENVLARPVHPDRGCVEVPQIRDHYGGVGPDQANLILKIEILRKYPGFGVGSLGFLFYAATTEVISSQDMAAPPEVNFFMSRGRITVEGTDICLDDHRFPALEEGDDAIIFVEDFRPRDTPGPALLQVGEGYILGIRDGKILQEGTAYRALGEPDPSSLEAVMGTLTVGVGFNESRLELGLPLSDYDTFPWVPRSQRPSPLSADGEKP